MANPARSPATASPHASVVFPAPPFRLISATVNMATKPIILDGLANQTGYIAILDVLIDGLADSPLPEPITAARYPLKGTRIFLSLPEESAVVRHLA